MRIAGGLIGREAHEIEQFGHPRPPCRPVTDAVHDQRLLEDVADRHARI